MTMLDFFIALFGGAYYGRKYAREKSKSKKAEQDTQQWIIAMQSDYDNWIRKVVDEQLEYIVGQVHTDDERVVKARERIKKEAHISFVSEEMILMAMLAQRKKIPKNIAENGIFSKGIWDYAERQKWEEERKFLLWYDNELRKNGLLEPLLFVDGVNANKVRHNINVATPITNASQVIGGRYFWKPMRKHIY